MTFSLRGSSSDRTELAALTYLRVPRRIRTYTRLVRTEVLYPLS